MSLRSSTQLDDKQQYVESGPNVRPNQYKGIESVGSDSSYFDLDITEYESIRPTPAPSRTKYIVSTIRYTD